MNCCPRCGGAIPNSMVMGYAGPICMCGNTRYTPTHLTPAVNRDILFEHEQTKDALNRAEAEVARLREQIEHDRRVHYMAAHMKTLFETQAELDAIKATLNG